MDDLTIGYNIAEILTLEPSFLNMLGFTYEETKTYLRYVLDKYTPGASEESFEEIWQLIVSNYDGYRFSPIGERLFNSTILTCFLKNLLLMPEVFRPNRTAVGRCGASERLCRRHEKEISQLSCPFVCSVYLCQQRMEMLGSLV